MSIKCNICFVDIPIGTVIELMPGAQQYVAVSWRRSSSGYSYIMWLTHCAACDKPIIVKTPFNVKSLVRRCEAHISGKRIKRDVVIRQFTAEEIKVVRDLLGAGIPVHEIVQQLREA